MRGKERKKQRGFSGGESFRESGAFSVAERLVALEEGGLLEEPIEENSELGIDTRRSSELQPKAPN